eukprot:758750-Hanusia_phi.AAC.1
MKFEQEAGCLSRKRVELTTQERMSKKNQEQEPGAESRSMRQGQIAGAGNRSRKENEDELMTIMKGLSRKQQHGQEKIECGGGIDGWKQDEVQLKAMMMERSRKQGEDQEAWREQQQEIDRKEVPELGLVVGDKDNEEQGGQSGRASRSSPYHPTLFGYDSSLTPPSGTIPP